MAPVCAATDIDDATPNNSSPRQIMKAMTILRLDFIASLRKCLVA